MCAVRKVDAPDDGTDPRGTDTIIADELDSGSPISLAQTIGLTDATLPVEALSISKDSGRYVQVRELGRGGMGRVDAVFDRGLGRLVARKTSTHKQKAHLVAEAQTCAQLEHPSIVPIYDVGVDETGAPQYTMRVIRGRTLRAVIEDDLSPDRPTMGLAQVLGIFRQVCLAVDYAHSRGVVHRDIKPDNVIVGEFGEVYVLDWGVAHVATSSDLKRVAGGASETTVAGSPGYMAPEQITGRAIDARTDVFALGVVLYELLSGELPFEVEDLWDAARAGDLAILAPPPAVHGRDVPAELERIAVACFALDPVKRPHTARWIADEIDAYLEGERDRIAREKEADAAAAEGERARESYETLAAEARACREQADDMLALIPAWESSERNRQAWELGDKSDLLGSEAARALARSEAAFIRALGRVADHRRARRGLAAIYFRQFEDAERDGDPVRMAKYVDLAREYDDGALALELADAVAVRVDTQPPGLPVTISRCVERERVLVLGPERPIGAPLLSGSHVVRVAAADGEVRYPVRLLRATETRITLRVPPRDEIPDGMILVPGGPFLARRDLRGERLTPEQLPDFAIGRFPVTLREYCRFLDALGESERERRTPRYGQYDFLVSRDGSGRWHAAARMVEGAARERVPPDRELDVPVHEISWYDAMAYVAWLCKTTRRTYRLPTDLEWEKATRGADGRLFPMGPHLHASFAKRRESRPEQTQIEPVGAFPLDESPYGVRDLAGGVGDLTATPVDGGEMPDPRGEGDPTADARQVYWRGAAWSMTAATRNAMRFTHTVCERSPWVGFRLALSLEGTSALSVHRMASTTLSD